tara:strand:+ start:1748 stop:2476 length:729 start_codon:yes stop_codon:yes gene_type:complete
MIFDLLKDLNKDCDFTKDIKESGYIEGSQIDENDNIDISKDIFYPNFIKCILSEFEPLCITLKENEMKLYLPQKIMEICSQIDENDEYFKDYKFHKSIKSHIVQQGLQLHDKRINHISSIYYLNEYFKKHFVIVYQDKSYHTCIKNYPKIYLSFDNHKVKMLKTCDFPEMNIKNLFECTKIVDDIKRDLKGIYKMFLEPISKYKLDDLKKIALECNIDLKEGTKNKTKSKLYDSINMCKLNH